jgi:FtsP/CotA-like multicopper oxidase with cupredoxin domain
MRFLKTCVLCFSLPLSLFACSTPTTQADANNNDASGDVSADHAAPPAPMPAVEGLTELVDHNPDPRVVEVDLEARPSEAEFRAGVMTRVWGYEGLVPGPLLHVREGDRVIVHVRNALSVPHIVHWHGLRISDAMDGSPRLLRPFAAGASFRYEFVVPEPGTFWYHAHSSSIEQIERGLYGAIVVHERTPPRFDRERIFVLDDVKLDAEGQIAPFLTTGPDIGRGRTGNVLLVNGSARPLAGSVARGALERWRIINAANARTMYIRVRGGSALVIGTDGGLIPTPYEFNELEIAPGQRYDLAVRADPPAQPAMDAGALADASDDGGADSGDAGSAEPSVELINNVPFITSSGTVQDQLFTLARYGYSGAVSQRVDYAPPAISLPDTNPANATDYALALSGRASPTGVQFSINGRVGVAHDGPPEDGGAHPSDETFVQGQPVRFTISANVSPEHPFHLHGQFFQIIERGGVAVTDEPGLKDTVLVRGRESVTILTYFENPGRWMYHCHISEHGENGMMGEWNITPAGM